LFARFSIGIWFDESDKTMAVLTQVPEAETVRTIIDAVADLRL
jgi:hypothetical protein